MIDFDSSSWLYLLYFIPFMFLLFIRTIYLYDKVDLSLRLHNAKLPTTRTRVCMFLGIVSAFTLLILGMADPVVLAQSKDTLYKNVRLFFLIDVSASMYCAEDIKPNRLEASKSEIEHAITTIDGVYPTYLIPFSTSPNLMYCADVKSRKTLVNFINDINKDSVSGFGTDLNSLFNGLLGLVLDKEIKDGKNIVILLSDGGKEDGIALDTKKINDIIGALKNVGFVFHSVGVGKLEATPLIFRDKKGDKIKYLEVDGKVAYSQLYEDPLKEIAKEGNGEYFRFDKVGTLCNNIKDVIYAHRQIDKEDIRYEKQSVQHYFFLAAFLLFWAGFALNYTHTEKCA